jgi:hypothetical protein
MTDHTAERAMPRGDLFDDEEATRGLLDQLLQESRLYKRSKDYHQLLDFVVRLRGFAPFNAMLLQIQKPGLSYAASAADWARRFGRYPKEGARPLLILWPFGPVALVYDVQDTEGKELPRDVSSFVARGSIDASAVRHLAGLLVRKSIDCMWVDAGDCNAGLIRVLRRGTTENDRTAYRIYINRNHEAAVQFTTLAHELGHLALGHPGPDRKLKVPNRPVVPHALAELEAESVAYVVCRRNGIEPKSETYLSKFVNDDTTTDNLDIYQIMRAAGQVETLLELTASAMSVGVDK